MQISNKEELIEYFNVLSFKNKMYESINFDYLIGIKKIVHEYNDIYTYILYALNLNKIEIFNYLMSIREFNNVMSHVVRYGTLDNVKFLLNINNTILYNYLLYSALNKNDEIFKYFINNFDCSELYLDSTINVLISKKKTKLITLLIEKKILPKKLDYFDNIISMHHNKLFRLCYQYLYEDDSSTDIESFDYITTKCISYNYLYPIKYLIKRKPSLINNNYILSKCIFYNDCEIIDYLMKMNAYLDIKNIRYVILNDCIDILKIFFKYNVDLSEIDLTKLSPNEETLRLINVYLRKNKLKKIYE